MKNYTVFELCSKHDNNQFNIQINLKIGQGILEKMTTEHFMRKIGSEEYFNKPGFVDRNFRAAFDRKSFLDEVLRDVKNVVVSEDGNHDIIVSSIMNKMKDTFEKHTTSKKVFSCIYLYFVIKYKFRQKSTLKNN